LDRQCSHEWEFILTSSKVVSTRKTFYEVLLQPDVSVAIHFGTFALGDDGEVEPVRELREALDNQISNFWILEHGEGRYVD